MKFPYHCVIRGGQEICQPKVPIVANGEELDVLLDTGGDYVWLIADRKLPRATGNMSQGGKSVPAVLANTRLEVRSRGVTYTWKCEVFLSSADADIVPVLGWRGFLEFFDVKLDNGKKEFTITPNEYFPGVIDSPWS